MSMAAKQHRPHYRGKSFVDVHLPRKAKDWTDGGDYSIAPDCTDRKDLIKVLKKLNKHEAWSWPKRRHFFFSDLHGDPEAFAASLVCSGGVKKTGDGPMEYELTRSGKRANFVIGGDCFDKGPSSLNLLRSIRHLKKQGARVRVLAGNHDVRVLFGMTSVGKNHDVRNEHFFIRTGQKIIPLLKEVWDEYLANGEGLKNIPSKKKCHELLYPRESWFDAFPKAAKGGLISHQIDRELDRIRKKYDTFEAKCHAAGMNLRQVYAAVMKWRELFLESGGEFYWFFRRMRLAYRSGSFLFVHAGLDDVIAKQLGTAGVKEMNRTFKAALLKDPFDFYYGPLCNTVRTKYRDVDHPFTHKGADYVAQAGVSAIIHGHRNLHNGQRIALRRSVLNFECDTSLDRETRIKENVRGRGASVTIIDPKGKVLGLSSDYPHIKVFDPIDTLHALTKKENRHEAK